MSSRKSLNKGFFGRPAGILMMFDLLLSLICFLLIVGWMGTYSRDTGAQPVYLLCTIHNLAALVIYIIVIAVEIKCCGVKTMHLLLLVHTAIMALFFLIASAFVGIRASEFDIQYNVGWFSMDLCDLAGCDTLAAASGMGFVTSVFMIIQAALHGWEWQHSD